MTNQQTHDETFGQMALSQRARARLTQKKVASKIPSKSIFSYLNRYRLDRQVLCSKIAPLDCKIAPLNCKIAHLI